VAPERCVAPERFVAPEYEHSDAWRKAQARIHSEPDRSITLHNRAENASCSPARIAVILGWVASHSCRKRHMTMFHSVCSATLISALAVVASCREKTRDVQQGQTANAAPDLLTLRGFGAQLDKLGGAECGATPIELRLVPTAIEIADDRREALVLSLEVGFRFAFSSGAETVEVSRIWELRTRQGDVVAASPESERAKLAIGEELSPERIEIRPPEDGYYVLQAEAYAYIDRYSPQDVERAMFFAVSEGEIRSVGISEWIDDRVSKEFQNTPRTPQYFPREPGEWQGRRMELVGHRACTETSDCRGAQACADGTCTGCTQSSQCLAS
jgi:hypothetical protein